ncbi:hypothetical protein [Trinickia mobilis]|uniref:hypothetical protein n=1 Tax=Trinickia mobilis TaxID=2816356 RepID=UPI001A8C92AC|nr:hypothetical protein [Trinickia mobilis]
MRRDKKLAEEILRTLVLDDEHWNMELRLLVQKLKDIAPENVVRYHVRLLEDIGLVIVSDVSISSSGVPNLSVRVTSAGQDRAENSDKPDAMETWAILGS